MGSKGISIFTATIFGAKKIHDSGMYRKAMAPYQDPKYVESYDRTEFIKQRAIELSVAAKLMEHMCEQGADDEEYTALVLYTYLVIDSVKYAINFTEAGKDLGIPDLMDKYMHIEK